MVTSNWHLLYFNQKEQSNWWLQAIGIYYISKERTSFSIVVNIKAATGALSFNSYPKNILERGLVPARLELEAGPGPDAKIMAKDLGALILNIRAAK